MKKLKTSTIQLENFIHANHFVAIRALIKGEATKEQQLMAVQTLLLNIAGFYQNSFDENNTNNTIFNEGKRWVARFIYETGLAEPDYFEQIKNLEKPKFKNLKTNINK